MTSNSSNGINNKAKEPANLATEQEATENDSKLFGGIEGGATKTNMVIIDCKRNILAEGEVGPTNPWLVGFKQSASLLIKLIEDTKARVIGSGSTELEAIGLSLSGCGQEDSRQHLRDALKDEGYDIERIFIEEDIIAPVYAISYKGGVNMICGTGSNCVVYNEDGSSKRVGGWGHLLGDEGGGYFIAHRAIKALFDHDDNYRPVLYTPEKVRQALYKYMKINTMDAILDFFYRNFSKDFIAGFTKELAKLARDGDMMAMAIFYEAGVEIGRHVLAVQAKIKKTALEDGKNLNIICTGSVFKSWRYLAPGFERIVAAAIKPTRANLRDRLARRLSRPSEATLLLQNDTSLTHIPLNPNVKQISMIYLKIPASVGGAVWAASKTKVFMPDPNKTDICEILHQIDVSELSP